MNYWLIKFKQTNEINDKNVHWCQTFCFLIVILVYFFIFSFFLFSLLAFNIWFMVGCSLRTLFLNFYTRLVFPSRLSISSCFSFYLSFFFLLTMLLDKSTFSFACLKLYLAPYTKGYIFFISLSVASASAANSFFFLWLFLVWWLPLFFLSLNSSLRCSFCSLFLFCFLSLLSVGVALFTRRFLPLNKLLFLRSSDFFISSGVANWM